MKLLFITPFVPGENVGHAGGVTSYHFVEGLARRGHEVHLLTMCRHHERPLLPALRQQLSSVHQFPLSSGRDPSWLARLGHHAHLVSCVLRGALSRTPIVLLRYRYPEFGRQAARLVEELEPDLVQIEFSTLLWVRNFLPPRPPVLLDTHEVWSLTMSRALQGARRPRWFAYGLELASWIECLASLEGFERILTVSDQDRLALQAFGSHLPLETVPQGVDCQQFAPRPEPPEPNSLVFVGSYDHAQNLDAASILLDRVLPAVLQKRPGVRLHLVGNHPPRWLERRAGPNVIVPGFVPDLGGYVGTRQVFVAPLRRGAGIKIKLLQAMALGLPVVTTVAGAEGIGLRHRENALVARNVDECAPLCLELLEDEEKRRTLGEAGLRLVRERFHRSVVVAGLERVQLRILESSRRL